MRKNSFPDVRFGGRVLMCVMHVANIPHKFTTLTVNVILYSVQETILGTHRVSRKL